MCVLQGEAGVFDELINYKQFIVAFKHIYASSSIAVLFFCVIVSYVHTCLVIICYFSLPLLVPQEGCASRLWHSMSIFTCIFVYVKVFYLHYENTPIQIHWKFYHPKKMAIFQIKKSHIFHISAQNIDCGHSLEPPRRGVSNEYPQSMLLSRNNKQCIPL